MSCIDSVTRNHKRCFCNYNPDLRHHCLSHSLWPLRCFIPPYNFTIPDSGWCDTRVLLDVMKPGVLRLSRPSHPAWVHSGFPPSWWSTIRWRVLLEGTISRHTVLQPGNVTKQRQTPGGCHQLWSDQSFAESPCWWYDPTNECQVSASDTSCEMPQSFAVSGKEVHVSRVTTCRENLEMSGNLKHVREMSGEKSCHGKVSQNCLSLVEYLHPGYCVA